MERLYSLKEASRLLGIHWATIERWDNEGKMRCIRLPNNYRKVPESEIRRLRGEKEKRREIIYARVSSQDQKGDLQRQIEKLKSIAPDAEVLSDVMSGMNFERKSFRKLIEGVLSGDTAKIYITHRDRLARFGFDLIEQICQFSNVGIVVTDGEPMLTAQEELTRDLISIITSFSAKLYGLRSHKTRKILKAVKSQS